MSRISKKGIKIPEGTEVSENNGTILVKGSKGALERLFKSDIKISINDKDISFASDKNTKQTKALLGTYAAHVRNMVQGVNQGFEKKLILEGIGFKSEVKGNELNLSLGFSHPVKISIPVGLAVKAEKNLITVSGVDKEAVGQFTARVRALKKPEPYKGKGFRYEGEIIRRKQGKKSV